MLQTPERMVKPGAEFQQSAVQVVVQIAWFIIVYLFLVVAGSVLAAFCVYAGVTLLLAVPKPLIIVVALGVIGLGLMVLFFLLKFMFSVSRQDRSGYLLVNERDQPDLFAAIRQISFATGAPFPKYVYLSPDVNASVFYDSGFWSMFLPVKKNLVIGLGLVNTLNTGELKAVLAHEFGHFSQRSMKLGSYVYQVNRVIHNMLYDNDSYGNLLNKWASVSGVFTFFAGITVKIVTAVQWVQKKMYGRVNKNYMSLSRAMEFHADAVAAIAAGGNNLGSALKKLELADASYHAVLTTCDTWLKQNRISANFYLPQSYLMAKMAKQVQQVESFNRVNVKDQWASHPPLEERLAALAALGQIKEPDETNAWELIREPLHIQEAMTQLVYKKGAITSEDKTVYNFAEFQQHYERDFDFYSFPKAYNGCYDDRMYSDLDLVTITTAEPGKRSGWQTLCTYEQSIVTKRISGATTDIQLLQLLIDKQLENTSFDFDSKKLLVEDAADIKVQLEKDVERWQAQLVQFDLSLAKEALQNAVLLGRDQEAKKMFGEYFELRKELHSFDDDATAMFNLLHPVLAGQTLPFEEIHRIIADLKANHEPAFKRHLGNFTHKGVFLTDTAFEERLSRFLQADYAYFSNQEYFETELNDLITIYNAASQLLNEQIYEQYKRLLTCQMELLSSPVPASTDLSTP